MAVNKIALRGDELRLEGNRVLYEFDVRQREFAGIIDHDRNVTVTIQLAHRLASRDEANAVLARVFCQTPEDVAGATPEFWHGYVKEIVALLQPKKPGAPSAGEEAAHRGDPSAAAIAGGEKVYRFGEGGATSPKPRFAPEPEFTETARKFKHQGIVGFNVVVDRTGKISYVELVQALGMGLDEIAAETIRTWKFDPAKLDGEPVNMVVYVEVSFRLFSR
jgi:TonB family protein